MYGEMITSLRTFRDETKDFPIRIGLLQGLTLILYMLNLALNMLIRNIQSIIPKCMSFAKDIALVLIKESREDIDSKLEL